MEEPGGAVSPSRCPCRSPAQKAATPRRRSPSRSRRAHPAGLPYLALVHLPQVPEDVPAGRREMRPHGARAHHGGLSKGRDGPPLRVSQTAAEPRPAPAPAYRPPVRADHVTGSSLGRLGMVVLCESWALVHQEGTGKKTTTPRMPRDERFVQ